MTESEKQIRIQIASEVAERFGQLAPYAMVQKFILLGPDAYKATKP